VLNFREAIVELYRRAATSLPADVEAGLRKALAGEEKGSAARAALLKIVENIRLARNASRPLCQDTGVPVFFLRMPADLSRLKIRDEIVRATRIATKKIPLRPNAVDILTEKNSGDNTGAGFPVIYFEETRGTQVRIDLMLKGAGSENVGQLYNLPLAELNAGRDLDGVRKCVLDAVYKAQGRGCPPYVIGVGIGGARDQATRLSKEQLVRSLDDKNASGILYDAEKKLLGEVNRLGIGPLGFGGKTTALAVKLGINHRHPASYFVDVSISCWAERRARLTGKIQDSKFRIQN
jgi:fumarate hydratase, class I